MICPKCKYESEAGAAFCGKCGRPLTEGAAVKPDSKLKAFLKDAKNRMFLAIGGGAAVVLIIVIAVVVSNLSSVSGAGPNGTTLDKRGFDTLFAEANADIDGGRYLAAVAKFGYIPAKHDKYATAQARIGEAYDLYVADVAAQAEQLSQDDHFEDALAKLYEGLAALPTSEMLTKAVDSVNERYLQSFITAADEYAVAGEYDAAFARIDEGLAFFADASALTQRRDALSADYKTYLLNRADELISGGLYDEATALLNAASAMFTDDKEIGAKGVVIAASQSLALAGAVSDSAEDTIGMLTFGGYEWRVLETQNDKMLVLAENLIDLRRYDPEMSENSYVKWEDCEIRRWLNDEFLNSFTEQERSHIVETTIVNNDNPLYGTDGGKDTNDKIFLLSLDEVLAYFENDGTFGEGFGEGYYSFGDEYNNQRVAKLDVSATKLGEIAERIMSDSMRAEHWTYDSIVSSFNGKAYHWWLRTPWNGRYGQEMMVLYEGGIGGDVSAPYITGGVRPAMWLMAADDLNIRRVSKADGNATLSYVQEAITMLREGIGRYDGEELGKLLTEAEALYRDTFAVVWENYVANAEFTAALNITDSALRLFSDDTFFTARRDELKFAEDYAYDVSTVIAASDYDSAIAILADALTHLPDNIELRNLYNETLAAAEKEAIRNSNEAVTFYEDSDGGGWAVSQPTGYEAYSVGDMGFYNDSLSSVRINVDGITLILYYDHEFSGRSVTLTGKGLYNLKDYDFDGVTSSYKIIKNG